MTNIFASSIKQTILSEKHDLADKKYYSFVYRPQVWQSNKVYLLESIVIPSTFNGFYYVCTNPGLSGSSQPIFPTKLLESITDNICVWQAKPYNLLLKDTDSISTSIWAAGTGITISDPSISGGITSCKVEITDSTKTEFELNNHTVVSRNGKTEEYDRSVKVKIGIL